MMASNFYLKLERQENLLFLVCLAYYNELFKEKLFLNNKESFLEFVNQDTEVLYKTLIKFDVIKQAIQDYQNKANIQTVAIKTNTIQFFMYWYPLQNTYSGNSLFYHLIDYSITNLYFDCSLKNVGLNKIQSLLDKPLLTVYEAVILIKGFNLPSSQMAYMFVNKMDSFKEIYHMVYDSYKLKEINITDPDIGDYKLKEEKVRPVEFLQWAYKYKILDTKLFQEIGIDIQQYINKINIAPTITPTKTLNGGDKQIKEAYPQELRVAVDSYEHLYIENSLPKGKSDKAYIESYIQSSYPKLSDSAIKRITTLINPNKTGGAPKTE